MPSFALRALRALIAAADTASQNQQVTNLQNECCTNGFGSFGAALGYGLIRQASIISYSKRKRSAALTLMQAESSSTAEMSDDEREKVLKSYSNPKKSPFANSAKDKIVLPILSALAIVGGVVPITNLGSSPTPQITQKSALTKQALPSTRPGPPASQTVVPPQEKPSQIASAAPSQDAQQINVPQKEEQTQKEVIISRTFQDANECLKKQDRACAATKLNSILELDPNNERAKTGLKQMEVAQRIENCIGTQDIDCIEKGANELLRFNPQNQEAKNLLQQVTKIRSQGELQKQQSAAPGSVPPSRADTAPNQQVPNLLAAKDPRERCAGKDNFISRELCEARTCQKPDYKGHPYCERFAQRTNNQ